MSKQAGKYTARVKFRELLEARGVSAYRVAEEGRGRIGRNAVYGMARGDADRVDLGTLGTLAELLEEMTGERVSLSDLLTLERTS